MSIANRQKTWIFGDVLTASDLNNEFDNLINTVNNIDSDNIGVLETLTFVNNSISPTISINASGGSGMALEVIS